MTMRALISLTLISSMLFTFSGCAFFKPTNQDGMSLEQKQRIALNAAKSATFFAIKEIHKGNQDKQNKAALKIRTDRKAHV